MIAQTQTTLANIYSHQSALKYVDSCCVLSLSAYTRRYCVRRFESRLTTYKMLALNSTRPTFFVADMVIPFGRYGHFVWPMWSWPISYRPERSVHKEFRLEEVNGRSSGGARSFFMLGHNRAL